MSLDLDDAFETDSLILNERAAVLSGDVNPLSPGVIAPIGSYYLRTTGEHYRKIGALDNEWVEIAGPRYLQFFNRAGTPENIAVIFNTVYELPFFNRAGAAENIGII